MKIYLIPGLGFDHRIFSKLQLGEHEVFFLDWIEPLKEESFKEYAVRLSGSINNNYKNTILIGHSLGGMISQEIAQIKGIKKVVLISSIKSRDEMPYFFKMVNSIGIQNLFTKKLTLRTFKYWAKNHDYVTEEEQLLFRDMISKQSDQYLQWALKQLSLWQTPKRPSDTKILHIHGSNDKTFPINSIKNPVQIIEGGGHFMVYRHSEVVSGYIREFL